MKLLIDGYNLLHLSTVSSPGSTGAGWAGWRNALLDFLVEALDPALLAQTTIVFDAADAPKHLPSKYEVGGMKVLFAKKYRTADEQIAVIINRHTAPKKLTVVSSDHAVQRSARRRKAMAIDSEVWLAKLARRRNSSERSQSSGKPKGPLGEAEVDHWLEAFAISETDLAMEDVEDFLPKPAKDESAEIQQSNLKQHEPNAAADGMTEEEEIQAFAEAAFLNLEFEAENEDEVEPAKKRPPEPDLVKGETPSQAPSQRSGRSRASRPAKPKSEQDDITQPFSPDVWEDLARIFAAEKGEDV